MPVSELGGGLFRVTHPLPWGLDHVHCYALEGADGLTLVDAGLDTEATRESWRAALDQLGGPPVARLVLTHFHPDHVGASAWLAEATGAAEVVQGALDARHAAAAWGGERDTAGYEGYLAGHGMPPEHVEQALAAQRRIPVAPAAPTRLVDEGDTLELAGETFRVLVLPGHADGHIALLAERSGRLIGGDVILDPVTPNIGRWHNTAADPLADYLATLGRLRELRPAIVHPGHGRTIDDARSRATEIAAHHEERLEVHERLLGRRPLSTHDVSLGVWGDRLGAHERRFALAEAFAHLTRLEAAGRARRTDDGRWAGAATAESGTTTRP